YIFPKSSQITTAARFLLTSVRGDASVNQTFSADVNVSDGDVHLEHTDFMLPSVGFPLGIKRTYNSSNPVDVGFGVGWSFEYGQRLSIALLSVTWTNAKGDS